MDPSSGFGCWSGREWIQLKALAANQENGWNENTTAVLVGAGSGIYTASCPLATAFLWKATGSKVKRQDQPWYTSAALALWKYVFMGEREWMHECGVVPRISNWDQTRQLTEHPGMDRYFQRCLLIHEQLLWDACAFLSLQRSVSPRGIAACGNQVPAPAGCI